MISVFLVAASPRIRREVEAMFNGSGVEVVGSTSDLETAAEELSEREADIVLVSVDSAFREDLVDFLEDMRLPRETSIVLLVERSSANFAQRAIRAGVKGIFASEIDAESLISGLKAVANRLIVLSAEESSAIATSAGTVSEAPEAIEPLTSREKEVLQRMADGLANKGIAQRLSISEHTVKFHVASILAKLGASSRTEAVSIGIRNGLILF